MPDNDDLGFFCRVLLAIVPGWSALLMIGLVAWILYEAGKYLHW